VFSALEHLGDLEGDLEGLLVVESRVDEGLVVLGQAGLVNVLAAAEDLHFELAARLRDEIQDLKKELRAMRAAD